MADIRGVLERRVSLLDIDDVEGFVADTLCRSGIRFAREEFEDLLCEGLAILYQLAENYEPHRAGYAQGGSFVGYASRYLPRRLGDAWHASHPEHRRVISGDGSRRWVYLDPAVSFDEASGDDDGAEAQVLPASHWTAPVANQAA